MGDIIASSHGYRQVAGTMDEVVADIQRARNRLSYGLATIGTPWNENGVSREFGEKFPPSMDGLVTSLGDAGDGLTSIKGNFLKMARNIDSGEENNSR